MYVHSLLTTSVRGSGVEPTTAASSGLGVSAFMNAAFGVRFLTSPPGLALAGAVRLAAAVVFAEVPVFLAAGASVFTADFLAATFFAVAMVVSFESWVGGQRE